MGKQKSYVDVVSAIDITRNGRRSVPVAVRGVRKVGMSIDSYMGSAAVGGGLRRVTDSVKVSDDNVHKMACQMYSQDRSTRRAVLANVAPGTRRRLLSENQRIRQMVMDSCIEYTPEVCWAISSIIRENSDEAYELLHRKYRSLPAEVKEFYDAFVEDRYSSRAKRAQRMLKEYRLVADADERVDEFLESAIAQEDALDNAVDEAVASGVEMQEGAAAAMDEVTGEVKKATESYVDTVSKIFANGIEDIIAAQTSGSVAEETEDILESGADEPDLDGVDNPLDMDGGDEYGDAEPADVAGEDGFAVTADSAPRRRLGRRRVVRDSRRVADKREEPKKEETMRERLARLRDSLEDDVFVGEVVEQPLPAPAPEGEGTPLAPFAVGTQVQITYNGNLYNGTISAAGNGAVVVEGLPFEYFSARQEAGAFSGTAEDFTFAEEDVMALPAVGPEGEPLEVVEADAVVAEEPAEGDAAPEGAEGDAGEDDDDAPADSAPAGKVSGKVSDAADGVDYSGLRMALERWGRESYPELCSLYEDFVAALPLDMEDADLYSQEDLADIAEKVQDIYWDLTDTLRAYLGADLSGESIVEFDNETSIKVNGWDIVNIDPVVITVGQSSWYTDGGSVDGDVFAPEFASEVIAEVKKAMGDADKVSDAADAFNLEGFKSAIFDWYGSNIDTLRTCSIALDGGAVDEVDAQDLADCFAVRGAIFDRLLSVLESFFGEERVEYVVEGDLGEFLLDGYTLLEVKPTKMIDGMGTAWSLTFPGSLDQFQRDSASQLFSTHIAEIVAGILEEAGKVSDAMDPNEDKDERVNINWSAERLMQELKARRAGRGKKEVSDAMDTLSAYAKLSEKYDLPAEFFKNLFDERQSFVIDPKLKEASSREELFQHIDEWADSEGMDDTLKQFIADVKTAARFGFALSGLKKGNDYLLSFLGSTHAIQNGKRKDCYFATFGNVNTGKPIVLIANSIASEADLDYVKPEIIADAIFDCLDYGAEPAVVVDLESFGGIRNYFLKVIEEGKFTKAQKAMLKNNLLSSLRGAVNDSMTPEAAIDMLLERAKAGEDLESEDGEVAFFFDEDGDVYVAVSGFDTHSLVESDVRGYLQEHIDTFAPLVGDVKVTDATPAEEAAEAVAEAEAAEVAEQEIAAVADDVAVGNAVRDWVAAYCFRLGQNPVTQTLQEAAVALSDALVGAGVGSRVDASIPRVLVNDQRFIDVKANGIYVGTSLYMYQTADDAIANLADSVSDAAVSMYLKIKSNPISGSTVASDVDDNLRESMEDTTDSAEAVKDATGDDSLLSEVAKQEIVNEAERKVKDLLEEQGIDVTDSDVDTLESFRAKRDAAAVLDSVLSKASEAIGSRVSPSLYRSMQSSSSKAAKAKLRKVTDAAVSLDALDVVCPTLYKEKESDKFWVADSVKALADSFGAVLPNDVDGRCIVSSMPIPSEVSEGRYKFSLSVGSSTLEVLV